MKLPRRLFCLSSSLVLFWLATTSPLQAQIASDGTLSTNSRTTDNLNFTITDGNRAGGNLFHSFREFSIPTGGSAVFTNAPDIQNIISRVTGSSVSNIDGLLKANGTANLFLLNPNGVIFGPNARLNIGGSFLTSTASSLNFADNTQFSATSPQAKPLLTVSAPISLQFGRNAADILVQGAGLAVQPEKTLALVGGAVTLTGGDRAAQEGINLAAPGGRIELGSVAANSPVSLKLTDEGWVLGYEDVQNFQNLLSQQAFVDVSGLGGGDIQVQGKRITLSERSSMFADTLGSGSGGTLAVIASESVEMNDLSNLNAWVLEEATGTGGKVLIDAKQLLIQDGAQVSTATTGPGKAGNLTVRADLVELDGIGTFNDFTLRSGLGVVVWPGATGDGGNLTIATERLIVRDGAEVLTSTFGSRKAGNLTVQNAREVELAGGIVANGKFLSSGLFATAEPEATGTGGNLSISTGKLTARDGAQVSSTTFSAGDAGDVTVRASEIELVGVALSADGELLTNDAGLPLGSGLFAGTEIGSSGNGGTLTVVTDRLNLRDGAAVQTTTFGAGNAGNLKVQASEIELIGTAKGSQFPTGLLAVSGGIPGFPGVVKATGKGGNLSITTGELLVQDGAAVAVSSLNPISDAKGAGTLAIQAQTIRLNNQGRLTSATASGDGGDTTLQDLDLLLLSNNSQISTTAGTAQTGGDGGNITIDTDNLVALENSDITANAFEGRGGEVRINTHGDFRSPDSDITASSELGIDGVVVFNTPDVDPSQGLVALPEEVVDISGLIAQTCPAGSGPRQSKFVVTGRGGLPPNPGDPLSTDAVQVDLVTLNPEVGKSSTTGISTSPSRPASTPIVEAQGWIIDAKGNVVLTANAPTVNPHGSWQKTAKCSSSNRSQNVETVVNPPISGKDRVANEGQTMAKTTVNVTELFSRDCIKQSTKESSIC